MSPPIKKDSKVIDLFEYEYQDVVKTTKIDITKSSNISISGKINFSLSCENKFFQEKVVLSYTSDKSKNFLKLVR